MRRCCGVTRTSQDRWPSGSAPMSTSPNRRQSLAALLCIAAAPGLAHGAIFTVGTGVGCSHNTIQAAVNAAAANPGFDAVRITRSLPYTAQAVQVNDPGDVNIVGGFATCDQAATDSGYATVSGAGGALEPVFRITVGTGRIVRMRHLAIRDGDEDGAGYGGGIYFRGDGILELIETTVSNNTAGYGGGIYAEATGSNTELVISNNVLIQANTARYSGGGVYNDGTEMTMNAPDSWIAFNKAEGVFMPATGQIVGGYGGGIQSVGGARDGYLYIGSPGVGGAGPVYANEARYGGGISVMSVSDDAFSLLQLYSTDGNRQTALRDNFASVAGGGLYLWSEDRGGFLVGWAARAVVSNASLIDNAAPDGAAAYLARTPGLFPVGYAGLFVNTWTSMPAALPCPVGRPCSYITGNVDQDIGGQPTGGAVLLVDRDNDLWMEKVELSGNRGGRVLRAIGGSNTTEATNTLWHGNTVSQQLIRTEDEVDLLLENSTLAGNAIGAAQVISSNGSFRLQRSVLWQPGKTSLSHSGSAPFAQNVVTSERNSLDGGNTPYVLETSPRFVDVVRSDYRLRAASPAVDFASTGGGPDLVGVERGIDLPIKQNLMGSGDLGAYERPALAPLVLFGDFDVAGDLGLWPEATTGASTWTSAQNAVGGAGSGSILVSQSNIAQPRVTARSQCIHLPGPGRYLLNGFGRSAGAIGTRDSVLLNWQLRHSGGEACNAGPPNNGGDHFLSTSTGWVQPAVPAQILVSEADWTSTTSLTVALVVFDNGISFPPAVTGWFDGITLQAESLDLIFADDFE
jgi:predicted outer membrane repeat protein